MMINDELSHASITRDLKTEFVGRNVVYHPSTTSTMDLARQLARDGAPEGTIVLADEQTAGKGRLRRAWIAPPGASLLVTILLRPHFRELSRLTIAASLAVAHAVEDATGLSAGIKWPNDVLVGGKKICGILLESDIRAESVEYTTVGVGLNVNFDAHAFPEIATTATSLMTELGKPVSRLQVLQALLHHFERYYLAIRRGEPIHLEWKQRLETLGRWIRVTGVERVEEGYAESVDEDGRLLLRHSDGTTAQILAGDVTLRT